MILKNGLCFPLPMTTGRVRLLPSSSPHGPRAHLLQVGKAAAFCIGVAYVAASTLQALGYVDVNWTRVREAGLLPLPIGFAGERKGNA